MSKQQADQNRDGSRPEPFLVGRQDFGELGSANGSDGQKSGDEEGKANQYLLHGDVLMTRCGRSIPEAAAADCELSDSLFGLRSHFEVT